MALQDLTPSLFYKNLVACNTTRDQWRISIVPPQGVPSSSQQGEVGEVALRLVPNYEPPYSPLLVCGTATAVLSISLGLWESELTRQQTDALTIYELGDLPLSTAFFTGVEGKVVYPPSYWILWLVKNFLPLLAALPGSPSDWEQILNTLHQRGAQEELVLLYQRRYRVVDMGRIYAIKWARLHHSHSDAGVQLNGARELHTMVLQGHAADEVDPAGATERTLRNILSDYYDITQ
jgi:hypothetical protein